MTKLDKAYQEKKAATSAYYDVVKQELPEGTHVSWTHGNHRRYGIVQITSMDRVHIISESGRTYWIDSYRLLELFGGEYS